MTADIALSPAATRLLKILDENRRRPVFVADAPRARRQLYAPNPITPDGWTALAVGAFNARTLAELTDHNMITFTEVPEHEVPEPLRRTVRATAVRTMLALRTLRIITLTAKEATS